MIAGCPHCGYRFDVVSGFSRAIHPPRPHDFTICHLCGAVLRFNADLSVHVATPFELDTLDLESYAQALEISNFIQLRPLRLAAGGGA